MLLRHVIYGRFNYSLFKWAPYAVLIYISDRAIFEVEYRTPTNHSFFADCPVCGGILVRDPVRVMLRYAIYALCSFSTGHISRDSGEPSYPLPDVSNLITIPSLRELVEFSAEHLIP